MRAGQVPLPARPVLLEWSRSAREQADHLLPRHRHLGVLGVGDDAEAAPMLVFVLVLPAMGSVRVDDQIEQQIEGVESDRGPLKRALEVDVPPPP